MSTKAAKSGSKRAGKSVRLRKTESESESESESDESRLLKDIDQLDFGSMSDKGILNVVNDLRRTIGEPPLEMPNPDPLPVAESSRKLGDVHALNEIWNQLGFGEALGKGLQSGANPDRSGIDAETLVRAMVFYRLRNPTKRDDCPFWLETVEIPGMPDSAVTRQHLMNAIDALVVNAERVESELASRVSPQADRPLRAFVFDRIATGALVRDEIEDDDDFGCIWGFGDDGDFHDDIGAGAVAIGPRATGVSTGSLPPPLRLGQAARKLSRKIRLGLGVSKPHRIRKTEESVPFLS